MSNISLIGKTISKVKYTYDGLDHKYTITFDDGTVLDWGYENHEGHTRVDGEDYVEYRGVNNG